MDFFVFMGCFYVIGLTCYAVYLLVTKNIQKKKLQQKIDFKPEMNIDFSNTDKENLSALELQELRKIYIQLIDVESKIENTNKKLDSLQSSVSIIVFFIVAPIIIGIILKILGINILSSILGI